MTSIKHSTVPSAARRWPPFLAAAACLALTACGNGFMDEGPDMEIPSGCVSGRLGCVTEHNIAMAVARPSDLDRPRRQQRRDPQRREAVMSAYRQGTTPSPSSSPTTGATLQGGNR